MLLDALGVGAHPLVGLAVAHEAVVGKVGGPICVAPGLVVGRVVAVRDCHELVGEPEVQVALVEVAVPAVRGVVPGEVYLAPLAVYARGVPGVPVALHAAVGDAGGVEELGVDALVGLACALAAREAALGGAPVERVVVVELVERPVVQPERHVVLRAARLGVALGHRAVDDLRDRRPGLVIDLGHGRGAKVPDVAVGVHEVEVDAVGARGGELEAEVAAVGTQLVVAAPLRACGVADAFLRTVGVPVRRHVHARLGGGAAAGLRDVERGCGACGGVVPADGEGHAVLLGGGGVGVGHGLGRCGLVGGLLSCIAFGRGCLSGRGAFRRRGLFVAANGFRRSFGIIAAGFVFIRSRLIARRIRLIA